MRVPVRPMPALQCTSTDGLFSSASLVWLPLLLPELLLLQVVVGEEVVVEAEAKAEVLVLEAEGALDMAD